MKKYEEKDQGYYCLMIPKMLEQWNMRGHSVSMDRAYTSLKLFILLKEKVILCEVLSEQIQNSYQSSSIFKKKEKRGTFIFAVNKKYSMVMTAWQDSKPVHLLSTVGSTKQTKLKN